MTIWLPGYILAFVFLLLAGCSSSGDETVANSPTFSDGIAESLKRFQPEMAAKAYVDLMQRLISRTM